MKTFKNIKKYPFIFMIAASSIIFAIYHFVQLKMTAQIPAAVPISGDNATLEAIPPGVNKPPLNSEQITTDAVPSSISENKVYEFETVDESYLNDALFIGDSRSVGLFEYAGWDNAAFYVEEGLTIWNTLDQKMIPQEDTKEKKSVRESLLENTFGKIYIMVGINELGRGTPDTYLEEFKNVIQTIRMLQPDAIIYIEAVMHVTAAKDEEATYINNAGINERNARISTLADNQTIFYIDLNPSLDDDTGALNEDYTFDGVHLKASYIPLWKTFLLEHAIVKP